MEFDAVKVFSATRIRDRQNLGETITAWIRRHPEVEIVAQETTQSSDNEFHCLSITIFYKQRPRD